MTTTAKQVLNYLLVEDNDNHAKIVQQCIRYGDQPHNIQRVKSGTDCLKYLAGEDPFADRTRHPYPDVVLLDIRMPGTLDGLQTLQAIRGDPRHRSLVVMMLTTSDRDLDVNRAYELDANGYIVKSSNTTDMIEQLLQIRWSFDSLVRLPKQKQEPDLGSRADTDAQATLPAEVETLLQPDEDAAFDLLLFAYRKDRDETLRVLNGLELVDSARFASLVYRFCMEGRDSFAGGQHVDWAFLRKMVMEKLPQYVDPQDVAGVVAGITAVLEARAWDKSELPSLHVWQGFVQARLSQSLYSSSSAEGVEIEEANPLC